MLTCSSCDTKYPIRSGVPRFVPDGLYANSFGRQWQWFRTVPLDSETGIRVIEALLKVNEQLGTTTLIITHNASIQEVADRVLFFADGKITREHKNEQRRQAASLSW